MNLTIVQAAGGVLLTEICLKFSKNAKFSKHAKFLGVSLDRVLIKERRDAISKLKLFST